MPTPSRPDRVTERDWPERIEVPSGRLTHLQDEHLSRYSWAAGCVSGRVLDVACGTGYGSRMLAKRADVVGLDQDTEALARATAKVPAVTFVQAEIPPLPFEDGRFDFAVSFETVEHVERDLEFVRELRRVLVPGGHAYLSTPNRAVSSPNNSRPPNPFHVREYLLPDLLELVRDAGFTSVEVLFQRREHWRAREHFAAAILARAPALCRPGSWWDRMGHGSSEVQPWAPEVMHPAFWILDCC